MYFCMRIYTYINVINQNDQFYVDIPTYCLVLLFPFYIIHVDKTTYRRGIMRSETCCFTGHRPQSLPWGFNENDIRCKKMKKI